MDIRTWRGAVLIFLPVLLLLAGASITLAGLDDTGFMRRSECRTAVVAREMLQSRDYLTPTVNGHPRFEKPPLYYWAIAAVARYTGSVNEFAARLPAWGSAALLAGFLGCFAICRARARGHRTPVQTGLLSALLLLCLPGFWQRGIMADAESLLALSCFAVTAALYSNLRDPKPQRLLAAYLLSALAFLAKGPVFLLFTWPAYLWQGRLQHGQQARWHLAGIALFLPLALFWYAAAAWNDPGALSVFFNELGQRFDSGKAAHPQPLHFYFTQLLASSAPLTPWLPFAFYLAWQRSMTDRAEGFLFHNAIIALLILSLLQSKQAHYLLPLFPFLALWLADWAGHPAGKAGQWLNAALLAAGALLALGAGGALWIYGAPWLAAVFLALSLSAGWLWTFRRHPESSRFLFAWMGALVVAGYALNWQILQPLHDLKFNQSAYFQALRTISASGGLDAASSDPCFIFGYEKPAGGMESPGASSRATYLLTETRPPSLDSRTARNFNAARGEWLWKQAESSGFTPAIPLLDARGKPWQPGQPPEFPRSVPAACGAAGLYLNGDVSVLRLNLPASCPPGEWLHILGQALRSWQGELTPWKLLWLQGDTFNDAENMPRAWMLRALTLRMAALSGAALLVDEAGLIADASLPDGFLVLDKTRLNGGLLSLDGEELRLDRPGETPLRWRRVIGEDGPRLVIAP